MQVSKFNYQRSIDYKHRLLTHKFLRLLTDLHALKKYQDTKQHNALGSDTKTVLLRSRSQSQFPGGPWGFGSRIRPDTHAQGCGVSEFQTCRFGRPFSWDVRLALDLGTPSVNQNRYIMPVLGRVSGKERKSARVSSRFSL